MKKIFLLILGYSLFQFSSSAQTSNVIYIVDSIPVIEDPEEGNEIRPTDIAFVNVISNRDSLKTLNYEEFDGCIFIFTKEYQIRPDSLKKIPSSKQMEKRNGVWYYRGQPYNGRFIDYYYSGKKQGEGWFQGGKADGLRTMYYQNGKLSLERHYSNGVENGMDIEYYEDGSVRQKGKFVNGKEEGVWEMYFPNGQVKQRSTFINGNVEGETVVYYSTGRILATEITRNGKTIPDKRFEKIDEVMEKGHKSNRERDFKSAIKHYSKAIEQDSLYAEAYFARGTVKLNDFQFDEAIADFDKAVKLEPYFERALSNRAFARINKYQLGTGRKLMESEGVTVMSSRGKPEIPKADLDLICNDLKLVLFLGDKGRTIVEAYQKYCEPEANR